MQPHEQTYADIPMAAKQAAHALLADVSAIRALSSPMVTRRVLERARAELRGLIVAAGELEGRL